MIDVSFEHWSYVFPEEELVRYGSPHFDRKTAGQILSRSLSIHAKRISSHNTVFDPKQILCGNEAFPEAAVADPLADLEVWDEWRSGFRAFPYSGQYSRLGIRRQEGKTSSPSSVGVLGEIMAGLYAQAGVSPWVLVRVIRRWPDFIFYTGNDRYAFVESKAYTGEIDRQGNLWSIIPNNILCDCLVDAVQQLNADPFVKIWGAFTHIAMINPLKLQIRFLELDVDQYRRDRGKSGIVPHAVISGIAERVIARSLFESPGFDLSMLKKKPQERKSIEQQKIEQQILHIAMEQLEELLIDEDARLAVLASRELIEKESRQIIKKLVIPEHFEGQRFFQARKSSSVGILTHLRLVGAQSLLVGDIDGKSRHDITNSWNPNWEVANRSLRNIEDLSLWRCGGAVFAIGDKSYDGTKILGEKV